MKQKHSSVIEVGSHLDYNQQVAQTYDCQRQAESNEKGVEYEGCVIDVLRLGPHDSAHRHLVKAAEDHRGQIDQQ